MFDPYRLGFLQTANALLSQVDQSMTVSELAGMIRNEVNLRQQEQEQQVNSNRLPACKECGGQMMPVHNNDGLQIMGCRDCRYSEVV